MATLYDMMGGRPFGDDPIRNTLWEPASLKYGRNPLYWTGSNPQADGGWSERQLALDPFSAAGLGTGQGGIGWYPDQPWNVAPFSIFSTSDNQRIDPTTLRPGQFDPLNVHRAFGEKNTDALFRKDMLYQLLGPHKAGDVILSDQERQMMQDQWQKEVSKNIADRNAAMRPFVEQTETLKKEHDQTLLAAKEAVKNVALQYDPRMAESLSRYNRWSNSSVGTPYDGFAQNPIDSMFPTATEYYDKGINQVIRPNTVVIDNGTDSWDASSLDRFYRSTDWFDPINSTPVEFGTTYKPSAAGYLNYLQGQGYDVSAAQEAVDRLTSMYQQDGEQRGNSWFMNFLSPDVVQAQMPTAKVPEQFQAMNQQQQDQSVINQQAYDKLINKGQQGGTIPQDFSRPFYGQITGTQGFGSQGDAWNPNGSWAMPNMPGMTYNPNGANAGVTWGGAGFGQQPAQRQNAPAAAWGGVFANQNPWGLS